MKCRINDNAVIPAKARKIPVGTGYKLVPLPVDHSPAIIKINTLGQVRIDLLPRCL